MPHGQPVSYVNVCGPGGLLGAKELQFFFKTPYRYIVYTQGARAHSSSASWVLFCKQRRELDLELFHTNRHVELVKGVLEHPITVELVQRLEKTVDVLGLRRRHDKELYASYCFATSHHKGSALDFANAASATLDSAELR